MKNIIISSFVIIFVLSSCKSKEKITKTTDTETNSKAEDKLPSLVGEWTLIKEICCGRTKTTYVGNDLRKNIKLKIDDKKNAKIFSLNTSSGNIDNYEAKVEFKQEAARENRLERNYLRFGDRKWAMFRLQNDTLIIDYSYMDLQTEFYVKK